MDKEDRDELIGGLVFAAIVVILFIVGVSQDKSDYMFDYSVTYVVYHATCNDTITAKGTMEHTNKQFTPIAERKVGFRGVKICIGLVTIYHGKDDCKIIRQTTVKHNHKTQ